jgi:putative DNA primase/helicase
VYKDDKKQARLFAAKQVISDLHVVTHRDSGQCYVWDPEEKVLDAGGQQRIGELLVRKLGTNHSQHEQSEITEKVRLLTAEDELGGEYIPVANGDLFLDGDSVRLEDADPDRAPLTRSDARWDPDAECKCFRGHLQGVMPSDRERETLQEYAGYCLLHWDIPFHKALFMVGPTASGKSTTLSAIRKLFGSVSKLSPQQLVNGRFGPAELEGAWANIRSDISAALLKDIGLFKEVVAGDPIFVERKYEQGYNLHPTAKHMYSANRLPEVSIDDDAFYRRILLVSFPTTIPRSERVNRSELDARLEQELDGILRWAVEGLQRVLEQNGFTHDLPPDETRHRWEEHASSIGRFKAAALNITGDSGDVEPKDRVHSVYSQFCQDHGLSTESKRELTRMLKRDPRITDGHRTPPGHSGQVRCYIGAEIDESTV